jgi:hypothetical protein
VAALGRIAAAVVSSIRTSIVSIAIVLALLSAFARAVGNSNDRCVVIVARNYGR